jgi:hypothetical protein
MTNRNGVAQNVAPRTTAATQFAGVIRTMRLGQMMFENVVRTRIDVRQEGDVFVAEWDGREVRAGNPFGLDSRLGDIGAPVPRDLHLIEIDGVPNV